MIGNSLGDSEMLKVQPTHISVLHKAILVVASVVWNFAVSGVISAEEQSFIYVSDLIQGQKNINSKREILQYQYEIPLTFQNKDNLSHTQYTYPPPVQKIGSNPISNPQHRYLLSLNSNINNSAQVSGKIYNYLPPIQKIGSNPFIKPQSQYVTSTDIVRFSAPSCDCEKIDHQSVLANY